MFCSSGTHCQQVLQSSNPWTHHPVVESSSCSAAMHKFCINFFNQQSFILSAFYDTTTISVTGKLSNGVFFSSCKSERNHILSLVYSFIPLARERTPAITSSSFYQVESSLCYEDLRFLNLEEGLKEVRTWNRCSCLNRWIHSFPKQGPLQLP